MGLPATFITPSNFPSDHWKSDNFRVQCPLFVKKHVCDEIEQELKLSMLNKRRLAIILSVGWMMAVIIGARLAEAQNTQNLQDTSTANTTLVIPADR